MLSISSTSIIIKAFDDLGLKTKKSSQLVFGALVVEDLVAILILVILPAIVIGKSFNGLELADKIANLSLFLLLWFTGGVFLIPTVFKKLKAYLTEETLIVVSLGLCLMMVVITVNAGISEALGAFVMGSILSGTIQSEKILNLTKPIKDFFGAIFFVSVGMLVNPAIVVEYWAQILLITLVIIIFKPLAATLGLLFSGQTLKIALQSGVCLCQIGEFSFIIAEMGRNKDITPEYLYPVIVSVSILTTFITPYWIKFGEPLYDFIFKSVKPQWRVVIERLGTGKKTLNREGEWNKLLKSYLLRIFIYVGWLFFVFIFFSQIVYPYLNKIIEITIYAKLISFVLSIICMLPFLYGLLKRKDDEGIFDKIWQDKKFARGPLLFMMVLKYLIATIIVSITISYYLAMSSGAVILLCALVIGVVILSNKIKHYYGRIENQFLTNLNSEGGRRALSMPRNLADEIHIDKLEVSPNSYVAGKTIQQIHRTKRTGALIIQIIRGGETLNLPLKTDTIFPMDILCILGTDNQIKDFKSVAQETIAYDYPPDTDMELFQLTLGINSKLIGENANISYIRDKFDVLIVGVEKQDSNTFIRPTSAVSFDAGDTIWIVGGKEIVQKLNN
jgi:Kef-type K+ transport systems, membrane components